MYLIEYSNVKVYYPLMCREPTAMASWDWGQPRTKFFPVEYY